MKGFFVAGYKYQEVDFSIFKNNAGEKLPEPQK